MKESTKEFISDYSIVIGIVLVLLVGIFLVVYYFVHTQDECISNPLVYGAKQFEDKTGVKVIGSLNFFGHPEVRISFDSNNLTIEKDEVLLYPLSS